LKSKEVKYWSLKIENLCALMGYLVSKIIFFLECSISFGFSLSFPLFYLTLTLTPLQQKSKTSSSCIAYNILVIEMRLKSKFMVEHIH